MFEPPAKALLNDQNNENLKDETVETHVQKLRK